MTLNEVGLLEPGNSIPQAPLIKNKVKELFGLIRSLSKPAHAHLREAPTASWGSPAPSMQEDLHTQPEFAQFLHLLQVHSIPARAHKVCFEDRLYWVSEQKVLNYRCKWTRRNTPVWSHWRMWFVTSLPRSPITSSSSAFSHFKVAFHILCKHILRQPAAQNPRGQRGGDWNQVLWGPHHYSQPQIRSAWQPGLAHLLAIRQLGEHRGKRAFQ